MDTIDIRKIEGSLVNISLDNIIELLNTFNIFLKKYIVYKKIRNDQNLRTIITNIDVETSDIQKKLNSMYGKESNDVNSN